MDPALQQTPLPYTAVLVGLQLPVLCPKVGAQDVSLQLPAHAIAAIRPLPGPGLLLPEGLLPVLQVGLQLQYQGPLPGHLALLLPNAAPPCGRFLGGGLPSPYLTLESWGREGGRETSGPSLAWIRVLFLQRSW